MADETFVIVGPDGTEHEFPVGMDPQRAAAIVRGTAQHATPRWYQPGGDVVLDNVRSAGNFVTQHLPSVGGAIGGFLGGVPGAALGGSAGEGYRQLIQHGAELPGAIRDIASNALSHPLDTATGLGRGAYEGARNAVTQAAIQGGAQAAGDAIGAGMRKAGPWLMEKAVKPTTSLLKEYRTTGPELAQTLLDNGINVTQAGVDKLQALLGETNQKIAAAVQAAPGAISKKAVAAEVLPTAQRLAQQVNATGALGDVGNVVTDFLDHPVFSGPTLSVPEAQAMKIGTYKEIGKNYGRLSSPAIEAQKALARGLRNEVAAAAPEVSGLNALDAKLMAALDATGQRVAVAGRADPVGFAWTAQHPATFLAALFDRNPTVKSLVARGLWRSAGAAAQVSPQMIRAAVAAVASGQPDDSPVQASDRSSSHPEGQ